MQVQKGFAGALAFLLALVWALAAPAAERDELRAFLEVTGFDVAIASMQQGAMDSPGMTGMEADEFGSQYTALAEKVFDPEQMVERGLDMLEVVLPDDLLTYGEAFYGSELGQRLVAAENESHLTPDNERFSAAEEILTGLADDNPDRIEDYRLMTDAIGGLDTSVRAVIEIQVRYLLAAIAAGSVDASLSEQELRMAMQEQASQIRRNIEVISLMSSAYAYRDFSDDDVRAYREALQEPEMRQVYEILNAVQFEVMAERYEVLAGELSKLAPQQDL